MLPRYSFYSEKQIAHWPQTNTNRLLNNHLISRLLLRQAYFLASFFLSLWVPACWLRATGMRGFSTFFFMISSIMRSAWVITPSLLIPLNHRILFRLPSFYTLKQLPPINSRRMELAGTASGAMGLKWLANCRR